MKINPKAAKTIEALSEQEIDSKKYHLIVKDKISDKYKQDIFSKLEDNQIYVKPGVYAMSTKKIDSLIRLAEIQKYYLCNPVRFIDDWFNIELLDAQAYIIQRAWMCPNVLLVCSRG